MKYEPFRDNVFLLIEKAERKTEGGLYLPDTYNGTEYGAKMLAARVMKAGSGGFGYDQATDAFQFFAVDVAQGDRVLIPWDAGQNCIIGEHIKCSSAPELEPGTEVRIVRNNEITAILE